MKSFHRIAEVEKLSMSLRMRDGSSILKNYPSFNTWLQALEQYRLDSSITNFGKVLDEIANMIDEALEGEES
jgi:hypothetical protein